MDLSQQELPLTSYFLKATKENDRPHRKRKLNSTHATGTVQNKRTKVKDAHTSLGQCTPDNQSVHRAKARTSLTHLPTPTTAVRRRPAVPAAQRAGDASPIPQVNPMAAEQSSTTSKKPTMLCEIDLTLSDSDDRPLESFPQSEKSEQVHEARRSPAIQLLQALSSGDAVARLHAKNIHTGLTTPATDVPKTALSPISPSFSPTAARGAPAHKFANTSPLLTPSLLPHVSSSSPTRTCTSKSASGVFTEEVLPSSSRPDDGNPFDSTVDAHPLGPEVQRNVHQSSSAESSTFAFDTSGPPTEVDIPVQVIASSQSQYLLSIEATPKRNRSRRCVDLVPGSQTQEEVELLIGMQPFAVPNRAAGILLGNQELASERVSEASRTLSSVPVHTPRPSGAADESSGRIQQVFSTPPLSRSPIQRWQAYHGRSPARSHFPSSNTLSQGGLTVVPSALGDDSATEPESDNEILQCVAQIGRKRAIMAPSSSSRGRTSRPMVSPLVSPVRRRYTPGPELPVSGSLDTLMEDGAGLSVPASSALSRFDGRCLRGRSDPSDSLPSVVREFMDMFKGDGSYPDDFPNSLRV
ncbi:hypothetical protein EDC04DRAFT_2621562 [Pisolithus marmoratus]|nr:hypothetical protein EDC04DRAFT_2621562 [Pisolithus marmoratus]